MLGQASCLPWDSRDGYPNLFNSHSLETHQPIALLADRKAETFDTWLEAHPGVEVLSRDRSKTDKSAMSEGAPDAI